MKQTTDTLEPKDLLRELQALVAEAEKMVADAESGQSDEASDSLRARFSEAQERLEKACAGAKSKIVAGAKRTDDLIRANPYQSLVIAASAGLLLGLLLGRRCKSSCA